jgi:hypothetical protein
MLLVSELLLPELFIAPEVSDIVEVVLVSLSVVLLLVLLPSQETNPKKIKAVALYKIFFILNIFLWLNSNTMETNHKPSNGFDSVVPFKKSSTLYSLQMETDEWHRKPDPGLQF